MAPLSTTEASTTTTTTKGSDGRMTIELTLDKTNELLDAVIAEKGEDYTYVNERGVRDACYYVHYYDNRAVPGCIVGNVLHRAGVPLETLMNHEQVSAEDVLRELDLRVHPGVTALLRNVQSEQDMGTPWGAAVATARARGREEVSQ